MKKSCTLCGCAYDKIRTFKGGYVCEDCLQCLKSDFRSNDKVRHGN